MLSSRAHHNLGLPPPRVAQRSCCCLGVVPVPHRTEHRADACVSRESVSSGTPQVPSDPAPGLHAHSSTPGLGPVTRAVLQGPTLQQDKPLARRTAAEEPQTFRDQAVEALWSSRASLPQKYFVVSQRNEREGSCMVHSHSPHETGAHIWGRASTCTGLFFCMSTSSWLSCPVFEVPLQIQI